YRFGIRQGASACALSTRRIRLQEDRGRLHRRRRQLEGQPVLQDRAELPGSSSDSRPGEDHLLRFVSDASQKALRGNPEGLRFVRQVQSQQHMSTRKKGQRRVSAAARATEAA